MIRFATLIAGIVLGALCVSAEVKLTKTDEQQIALQAKNARTAAEHTEVARLYEQRAAAFEAKAKRHEERADSMARREGYNPMKYKWPAMVQGPIDLERSKAMQARRAARETLELVARHREFAGRATSLAAE